MNCYATLFVNWIRSDNGHLELLLQKGLKPEIGLEHGGFDLPLARHREVAARFRDQGLSAAVHLPFSGIRAGSPKKWRQTREFLLRALEIAACYEPDHLIGHPEFRPGLDSRPRDARQRPTEEWLDLSVGLWTEILDSSPARLYLENTADQTPEAIAALLTRLPERAAMCFDIGHWFSAAGGVTLKNLPQWLDRIAGRLAHLHLHDNHGLYDQHLGLGLGGIDFSEFWALMSAHGLAPTFTLEAHNVADLGQSLDRLTRASGPLPLSGLD